MTMFQAREGGSPIGLHAKARAQEQAARVLSSPLPGIETRDVQITQQTLYCPRPDHRPIY